MNMFADPEHVWIAALTASAALLLSASITLLGVWLLLGQFLEAHRKILQSAILQTDSVDTVLHTHTQQIRENGSRIETLMREREERAERLGLLEGRLKTLEARKAGQVG